ncbi:hypothetical protein [Chryseobacterium sp. 2987]|uniref:hypothetical protein n=1 Tax=Chryseobacterium sp. 2987 TaxID=2817767 RepID=UPI002854677E|nr:hypothetical protein [Chryseobacterium sp. 2987]MDR6919513.1 hypothetical protein [Chryseobacterium sp. 2987]
MDRESKILPEIDILGTTFQFDIDWIVLIEKGDPYNEIYFDAMEDYGTHYEFLYNVEHKNYSHIGNLDFGDPFDGHLEIKKENNETVFRISIPRISELDPHGMMNKYGCSLDDLKNLTDFEIIVDQEVYRRRVAGEMVTIDIGGQIYEVDVNHNTLHSKHNPENDIDLGWFYYDYFIDDDESYYLFTNMETNQIVDVLYDRSVENLVIYKIPMISYLDPLACGYFGSPALFYHDLKMHHIAEAESQRIDVKSLLNKDFILDKQDLPTSIPIYENDKRFEWKEYKNHLIADYKEGNLTVIYNKLKMSDSFKIITPTFSESQKLPDFGINEAIKHIDIIVDKPSKISEKDLRSRLLSQKEYLKIYHSPKPKESISRKSSLNKRKGPKI